MGNLDLKKTAKSCSPSSSWPGARKPLTTSSADGKSRSRLHSEVAPSASPTNWTRAHPWKNTTLRTRVYHLDNTLMSSSPGPGHPLRRRGETQFHNPGAPGGGSLLSQEAYVKAWDHHPHGDHDETPPGVAGNTNKLAWG